MRKTSVVFLVILVGGVFADETPLGINADETIDEGYLGLEASGGYNTYETSQYMRAPLFFTAGSAKRDISTRFLVLSDIVRASDYFSGNNNFLKPGGIYGYNFGLLDIDYLSWHGELWAAGFGGGLAHQGFLIEGASKSAHGVIGRIRGQFFFYWNKFMASQLIVTKPFAFYQSATEGYNLWHNELNLLFDFKGNVRSPQAQAFMFAVSLHHDYVGLKTAVRNYAQHELTPMLKVTVLY